MPYLPFDLDAKKRVPSVARSVEATTERIGWGLVELWEQIWITKKDTVSTGQLAGFFGVEGARVGLALSEFGFLEAMTDGVWRVRGAAKWLFAREAKSRGGHAAKGNLRRGSRAPISPGSSPAPAGSQPGSTPAEPPAHIPAFSPSTQHPERNKRSVADATGAPKETSRLTALTRSLEAEFEGIHRAKYKHGGGKDTVALKSLLPVATDEEIRKRWRAGLTATGWKHVATFAQLGSKWNDLAGVAPGKGVETATHWADGEAKCRLV